MSAYVVLVAADHRELLGNVAQVVDGLLVAGVAEADHARDGARMEVLAEFLGEVEALLGDVQVGNQEDEFELVRLRRWRRSPCLSFIREDFSLDEN